MKSLSISLAILMATGGIALGQEADSPDEARESYLRGDRYYAEGDYVAAIAEFKQAYELSKKPRLLFNLANAYERLGRFEEAIEALRVYAPTVPEYEHEAIARRIRNLERRADEKGRRAAQISNSPASTQDSAPTPVLGWVLVGTGAVFVAGGIGSGLLALNARDNAKGECLSGICSADAKEFMDDDKRYSLIADIGIGVGAAAAIAGVVLIVTNDGGEERDGLSGGPTQDGFQFAYTGRF